MENKFARNVDYWLHKTKAFLHDPPDKAIHIPGHEERSDALLAAMGIQSSLAKEDYQQADIVASGMDRATLPGYVSGDETRNGAVDFCKFPQITHPTGSDNALKIKLPDHFTTAKRAVTEIAAEMRALLKQDLGDKAGSGKGLSEQKGYQGQEENFAPARFHYLFFMLRRRLAQENIGELGGLWHRLPADTRLPDHSVWQHCGLVSALASSAQLSEKNKASLMVYALTPVQDFVGSARKLRDYWSGSILLSWLAFEGIKAVIYELGADHIVYPSLHGQPLVDDLLQQWQMDRAWFDNTGKDYGVASFPNKFVCLVPAGKERKIADVIKQAIDTAWQKLADATLAMVEKAIKKEDPYIKEQFKRQLVNYWEHHWAGVPLVKGDERRIAEELLHKDTITPAFDFWKESNELWKELNKSWKSTGEGQLYSVSHRLCQAWLAAGKSRRDDKRIAEQGIKCDLFGEFEIIHYQEQCNRNPKPSEDPFWDDLRKKWPGDADFGKTERLCAMALVKRLAYRVCREMKDHPLQKMFKKADTFPSTTEMALHDWWQQVQKRAKSQDDQKAVNIAGELAVFKWRKDGNTDANKKLAQWHHAINEPEQIKKSGSEITSIDLKDEKAKAAARAVFKLHPVSDFQNYYAVLMMDGDKMGKLINGETLGATWKTVLHPHLVNKLSGNFDKKFKNFWQQWLEKPRLVSPAVHAAISEALGDFSLLTVPRIIEKNGGRLLYAGGDDVSAILPVSSVLEAAKEIAAAYGQPFITAQPKSHNISWPNGTYQPQAGEKLGLHLGTGDKISISAGILIAHHKKPLGKVINRAHKLLDMAKKEGGRNGFVLELDKRSGGGRLFQAKWQDKYKKQTMLEHFLATATALQQSEGAAMSSSLAYRLATFEDGLLPLIQDQSAQLVPFVSKQLDRSGLNKEFLKKEKDTELIKIAEHVAALIHQPLVAADSNTAKLPLESLIVANFIGHCLAHKQDLKPAATFTGVLHD